MWDEQERFARVWVKALAWLLLVLGVALGVASALAGKPVFIWEYLWFVGILVVLVLAWVATIGSIGAVVNFPQWLKRTVHRFRGKPL